jgi:predicted DNA-binding transcriptional regulator YafY
MLLQAHGQMTARDLARELEVSERTIYRDVEALGVAGVPVCAESGPGGGIGLVDSYRTNLTGLTAHEVRALFMLSIPQPLVELGVGEELRSALRKLAGAIPPLRRGEEEWARQRLHLDATWWGQGAEPTPHLQTIHQALRADLRLAVTFRRGTGMEVDQIVDPYGLVAKAGVWYLVYAFRTLVDAQRVAELVAVRPTDEHFIRPPEFELADFWQAWSGGYERRRTLYPVQVRVAPGFISHLAPHVAHHVGGELPDQTDLSDQTRWSAVTLSFESFEAARAALLACGRAMEVLAPEPLRRSLLDYALQIVDLYQRQT